MATVKIVPLGKDNYDSWKMQAKAYLIKSGSWKYVNGALPKPKEDDDAVNAWIEGDAAAQSDLILIVCPTQLQSLSTCETSHDMWKKLESIHLSKGPVRKIQMLKTLLTSRIKDGDDIKDHLTNFFNCVDKLKEMGSVIDYELLSIMMLLMLSSNYDSFRQAMEARDDLPTPEALKIKILESAESRELTVERSVGSDALLIKRTPAKERNLACKGWYSEGKLGKSKKSGPCYVCGRGGHKAYCCPDRKTRFKSFESSAEAKSLLLTDGVQTASVDLGMLKNAWCVDSGCTSHMCSTQDAFEFLTESEVKRLNLADKSSTSVRAVGRVKIQVNDGQNSRDLNLEKTLLVPSLRTNLISVSKATDSGHTVVFTRRNAYILDEKGETVVTADRRDGLYYIRQTFEEARAIAPTTTGLKLQIWYEKFGHLHESALKEALCSIGIKIPNNERLGACTVCISGKMTQAPFPKEQTARTKRSLEILYSDVCGPMSMRSLGGSLYFATFIDDHTRWCEVRFLREKSDLFSAFCEVKALLEKRSGCKLLSLQSENGGEYCSAQMEQYLTENGITHRLSVPRTPQQNGVAERKNRTLVEMARCMMIQSKVPMSFWAEAVSTANHIRNRCPSRSLNGKSPFEFWFGRKPHTGHFRTFGIKGFVLKKRLGKGKFDPRGIPCTFVGYSEVSKGFRVVLDGERRVSVTRDLKCVDNFGETETVGEFLTAETLTDGTHHGNPQDEDRLLDGIDIPVTMNGQMSVGLPAAPVTVPDEEAKRDPLAQCRGRPKSIRTGKGGDRASSTIFRRLQLYVQVMKRKKSQLNVKRKVKLSNEMSKLLL
uniref:Integrase catalytic domain-containing protein n=1 Tax=Trichuris muris TaxID=70415 RepID=A0A5S6QJ23_TRIMR